jgi:CelD/BcsL family acetyltransferase involved in cellulose biosynthesis
MRAETKELCELMDQPLTSEIVRDEAGLRALRPAWDTLHAATGGTNPFTQWTWVHRWWQVFGQPGRYERHQLWVVVLREPADATIRAIVPLIRTSWGIGPLSVHALRLYGFVGSFTELREPLIWPGWEATAVAALMKTLHAERRRFHWCDLAGLPADGPVAGWFAARAEAQGWQLRPMAPDYVLTVPSTWEAFRAGLKRNIKESLRHCYNSLARDGHAWSFEAVGDPEALPEALAEFLRLHAARAAKVDGPEHRNRFGSPARERFLRDVAQDLAAEGRLVVGRLRVNGTVVASRIVFTTGDSFYLYYSGFDPAWSKYSVATTVAAECIKTAIAAGARTVNLSTGTDVSKTRWGPEEHRLVGVRVLAPTIEARALHSASGHARKARLALRNPRRALPATVARTFGRLGLRSRPPVYSGQ